MRVPRRQRPRCPRSSSAVEARDAQALAQLAPPELPAADELLSGIAANVRSLDLTAVSARYVDQVGAVAADGSWTGVAELTWQLRGFDEAPARSDVVVSFAPTATGWASPAFAGAPTQRDRLPLWLRGRLSVARSGDVLVMVDGPAGRGGRRGRTCGARHRRRATGPPGLDARPSWSRCPSSAADLDETLGAEPGTYAGIAAVTAPVGATRRTPTVPSTCS